MWVNVAKYSTIIFHYFTPQVRKAIEFGNSWLLPDESSDICDNVEEPEPCEDNPDYLLAQDACYVILDPEGIF